MIVEYGISGYDPSTGLTGILPYLYKRKSEAYSKIGQLEDAGGYNLKIVKFTWHDLHRKPVDEKPKEVSELGKRLNEAMDKLEGK